MKRLIGLIVVVGLSLVFWTASWADMEEIMVILTPQKPEYFGCGVANVGDLNGDGYQDLVVDSNPQSGPEHAYIYFGGPSFDTIPDVTLESQYPNFGVGSRAGDVNGDGFDDIMAYCSNSEIGFVSVFYGGSPLDTVPDLRLHGKTGEAFGWTRCPAGDLNGDGYDDLLIGAYMASNGGKAYVFFGGNPMDTIPDLILRTNADHAFGMAVAGLGDVNGDGYPDIGVGDPWKASCTGKAYIYFGGPDVDRIPDLILTGGYAHSHFGGDIGGGDLNGDGYAEIAVSAPTYGDGRLYVFRGGPGIDDEPELIMYGRLADDEIGTFVKVVQDLDRDGYNDIISGTNHFKSRVYVYYGQRWMDRDLDLVLPDADGGVDFYGQAFDAIDIDGDGRQEVCVGSYWEDRVYIYRIRHKQFTIALKPDRREVVMGENVGFTATITNNTQEDQNLYFWVDLLDPHARPYGTEPVLGPKLKKVPAGKTVTRHISLVIPGDPILGQYTCTLKADTTEPTWPWLDFIENDSFEFQLVSEGGGLHHSFLSNLFRRR
jgi:hypothetical protein